VPLDNADAALMSLKDNNGLVQVLGQAAIGDLPNADSAVLAARGNDVVVEWAPLQIEQRSFVTQDTWVSLVDTTNALQGNNLELTATLSLQSNSDELGVDGSEDGVPGVAGDANVIIALRDGEACIRCENETCRDLVTGRASSEAT
jgi:hypothetical protein